MKQADLESLNVELEESQKLYGYAARRLEELFQNVPVACFGYDVEGVIHEWNKEASSVFALNPYEAIDRSVHELFVNPDEESG
ncbi:PAS domain-containing protein, partial [Acinetobacter baumannii]